MGMSGSKVYSCTDLISDQAEEKAKGVLDRFKCKFPNTRPLSLEDASSKVLGMKVIVDLTHDLVAAIFKGSEGGLQARDQDGYPIKLESTDEICRRLGTIFLHPIEANTWLEKAGYPNGWKPNKLNIRQRANDWKVTAREIADECFDADTNCTPTTRDSLNGYSGRVMEKMQQRGIGGSRGIITNSNTVKREALQGDHWWAKKKKC